MAIEPKAAEAKRKALATLITKLDQQFGKGTVMTFDDNYIPEAVPVISSGSIALDDALGIGGLPRGRIIEIMGNEASGKTTTALSVVAQAQKAGLTAGYIDAENALDIGYAQALGVDISSMLLSQTECMEEVLTVAEAFVESGLIDILVIDSVAAMAPKAEIEGDISDQLVGLQARLMSKALRKLTGAIKRNNVTVIFINQFRQKIGVSMPGQSDKVTTGGNALKFYASVRLEVIRTGAVKKGEEIIGNETKVKVIKNKMAAPFKEAITQILYGKGYNVVGEVLSRAITNKWMAKAGAWYSYNGQNVAQGEQNAAEWLRNNPDIYNKFLADIAALREEKRKAAKATTAAVTGDASSEAPEE